jgi:hypothetical protein
VVIEGEEVVGLPQSNAVVFAADCLNCRGVVVRVDAYEMVSEHGRTTKRAASPQQAALLPIGHMGLPAHDAP